MLTFRPLALDDFELVHEWLNEPGVVEWWEGEDVSADAVRLTYFTEVEEGVEHWLALDAGVPFGMIQCYPVTASPDEYEAWSESGVPITAAGIDYLVGAPTDRGHGRGTTMIDQFVADVVFGEHAHWTHVCAAPFSANRGSWGALANAGFVHIATLADPAGPCHLMMRSREAGCTREGL